MHAMSAGELMELWDWGQSRSPTRRALGLLAAALPGWEPEALEALSIGRRDRLLIRLRATIFGSNLQAILDCPGCAAPVELAFDSAALAVEDEAPEAGPWPLELEGVTVRWRPPDSGDLLAVESARSPAEARAALLRRTIVEARRGDRPCDPSELPDAVLDGVIEAMDRSDPDARLQLDVTCPECGHRWVAPLDLASFLWTEIHALAARLLSEVHALALAYGWSEPQILSVSPQRRAIYLEMIGA